MWSSAGSMVSMVMVLPPVRVLKKENIPPPLEGGGRERGREGGRESRKREIVIVATTMFTFVGLPHTLVVLCKTTCHVVVMRIF